MFHKINNSTREVSMVAKGDLSFTCQSVKEQCSGIAKGLIDQLDRRYPTHEVMNATCIIYLQYWLQLNVATTFLGHLTILR
jgi:hypothetical protein